MSEPPDMKGLNLWFCLALLRKPKDASRRWYEYKEALMNEDSMVIFLKKVCKRLYFKEKIFKKLNDQQMINAIEVQVRTIYQKARTVVCSFSLVV